MIYIFCIFYSVLCYYAKDMIPYSFIANGYIYIFVMYFVFPYIIAFYVKKMSTQIESNNHLQTDLFITNALIVKGAMSIYLPFHKKPIYAVSEKSYSQLTKEEIEFLVFHEHAHILYNDQINNMISFFTVLYVNPIILTIMSTNSFINEYIYIYLFVAVTIYLAAFVSYFMFTRKKELRADYYAAKQTSFKIASSTLKKIHTMHEMRERTFNILATHPSYKGRIKSLTKYQLL